MENESRKDLIGKILFTLSPEEVVMLRACLNKRRADAKTEIEKMNEFIKRIEVTNDKSKRKEKDSNGNVYEPFTFKEIHNIGKLTFKPGDELKFSNFLRQNSIIDLENEVAYYDSIISKLGPFFDIFDDLDIKTLNLSLTYEKSGLTYDTFGDD